MTAIIVLSGLVIIFGVAGIVDYLLHEHDPYGDFY
jgi:hypothetical protein